LEARPIAVVGGKAWGDDVVEGEAAALTESAEACGGEDEEAVIAEEAVGAAAGR
jgi:hypothetical protein